MRVRVTKDLARRVMRVRVTKDLARRVMRVRVTKDLARRVTRVRVTKVHLVRTVRAYRVQKGSSVPRARLATAHGLRILRAGLRRARARHAAEPHSGR
jgi:hypothetical protein